APHRRPRAAPHVSVRARLSSRRGAVRDGERSRSPSVDQGRACAAGRATALPQPPRNGRGHLSMRPDPLTAALFLTVAFVLAGLAHSAWLRTALSRRLMMPVDGGLRFLGRRVMRHKHAVRGFVVMVPAAALAFAGLTAALSFSNPDAVAGLWPLSIAGYGALGALAGLGFMAGEAAHYVGTDTTRHTPAR